MIVSYMYGNNEIFYRCPICDHLRNLTSDAYIGETCPRCTQRYGDIPSVHNNAEYRTRWHLGIEWSCVGPMGKKKCSKFE